MQDRGARHGELLGDFFLREAGAGSQRTVADGVQQHPVDLVHVVGPDLDLVEFERHRRVSLYFEFRVQAAMPSVNRSH
ncbi:hypothetical protein D9M68_939470 [compost metagenome]